MTILYSDLISITGCGLANAVSTVVPKVTGEIWTGSATATLGTAVQYDYALEKFVRSTDVNEAIGWCAINAASGDTTATVNLLPFLYYNGTYHGPSDSGSWSTPGEFNIFNLNVCQEVPKLAAQGWAVGNSIYWDIAAQVATQVSTGNLEIGSAAAVAGFGTVVGYYFAQYAFNESFKFTAPNTHLNGTRTIPRTAGSTINNAIQIAVDPSGDYFASSSTTRHGTALRMSTAKAVALADTTITVAPYDDADGKIWLNYKQMLISALNPQIFLLMPSIAGAQLLTNSDSVAVSSETPLAPSTRGYNYVYQVQPYKLMRMINFFAVRGTSPARYIQPVNSTPAIALAIPAGLAWNYITLDSPTKVYSPPGAIDQSATHVLVYENTWNIFKKTENASTHDTGIVGNKPLSNIVPTVSLPMVKNGAGAFTTFRKEDYGAQDVQTYVIDPTRVWNMSYVWFEGGAGVGTLALTYSVYRTEADGSETTLRTWTSIARNAFYSAGGLDYIKFDLSISLADLGEVYPLLRYQTNYIIKLRQYYVSVSPYNSFQSQFGLTTNSGLNYAGESSDYGGRLLYYQRDHAYYYRVLPYAMLASDGSTVTTPFLVGKSYENFTYDVTWTGTLTASMTVVDANRVRFSLVSTLTPSVSATNLVSNSTGSTIIRVRRLKDGLYLHVFQNQFTTPLGCRWSRYVQSAPLSYSATALGSGLNYLYRTSYTAYGIWVDKDPALATEDFEVEVLTYGSGNFGDSSARYFTRRDVIAFTI